MTETDITELINYNKDIDETELIELANCSHSSNEEGNLVQTFNVLKRPLSLEYINKRYK